jgi:folylpolyglutamate synthase/dihydropteroate synthase
MEGRKSKKPTKKQMMEELPKKFEQELKNAHIKGMVQGYELSNQMLLEWAENHTIEEVVEFCKKNVEDKTMSRVVSGELESKEIEKVIDTDK